MNRVIVVCGPTASGKTALAVELAKLYDGEVISADSMQIYTDMDIASAKATKEEQQGIPHHLMDFLDPGVAFSVADYVKLCDECVRDILSRGRTPVICGGTGLYISSFVDNLRFDDSGSDPVFREEMRRVAQQQGGAALLERLREIDPETAAQLHENNIGRVIRALEVHHITGHTISEAKRMSREQPSPYEFIMLTPEYENRERLYERINMRVDLMVKQGLVEEARACFLQTDRPTAAQAIGCKELYPYFRGEKSLEDCVEELKLRTRQYAKRQMTWFRRDPRIHRILLSDGDGLAQAVEKAVGIINAVSQNNLTSPLKYSNINNIS
ncbi:MAG: tRNA (adenosine(37)-N6)-dimethylallyltransferase MiaA [Oscillospiraceae bacterium]